VSYSYKASQTFWRQFYALPDSQKESVRAAWKIFKVNPFDERLGTHKIAYLSARAKRAIWSVVIEPDLRALFYIDSGTVFTIGVGNHPTMYT